MDQTNLDIYGHPPIPWSRAEQQLEATEGKMDAHFFLATVRPDGRPHVAGIGAVWLDGKFYIVSGPGTRKSRNLAENPNCVISVGLPSIEPTFSASFAASFTARVLKLLTFVPSA